MGERDRYQPYGERNEGRFQSRDDYSRDRDDEWRAQSRERGRNRDDHDYGREYGRDYERYSRFQHPERGYGYESRRFPESSGSHEDQRYGQEWHRDRGSEAERHYGGSQEGRNRGYSERYQPYGSYGRSFGSAEGSAYGGREWSPYPSRERSEYNRGYEGEYRERGGREEGFGQQLREAGERFIGKVKRVFRAPKGYKRSDERIREDVNDRLAQHDDLDPTEIEVSVSAAEVTLTGKVDTRREKFLAEEIADDVGGVTEVHNQLRVGRQTQTGMSAESTASGTQAATEAARNRNARAQ